MKILYLSLDPRIPFDLPGGNVTHSLLLAEGFRSLGHDVLVEAFMSDGGDSLVGNFSGSGGSFLKKLIPGFLWITARDIYDVWHDIRDVPRLEKIIDKFKPDIVYEGNAYLKHGGMKAALNTSVPYFLETHAPLSEERAIHFGAPLGWYHDKKEIERARAARGNVVVSGVVRNGLVDRGVPEETIAVFQNGVDPGRFKNCREEGTELRRRFNITGPVVGFVGSIAQYHGVPRLLDAVPRVVEQFPEVLFWIVGGGEMLDELKKRAVDLGVENNLRFEGPVPFENVSAFIGAFDMALLPETAYYCSPVKLFEYAAAGVPIIAPRTKPVEEVFEDSQMAVLIGPQDNLAEAIVGLINDPERAKAMAEKARRKILEEFNWNAIAKGIIDFIEERL